MVKWSDLTGFGAVPASWDHTSPSNSAGENIINEMKVENIDGLSLRDSFIIYAKNEDWTMEYIGGNYLIRWRKFYEKVGFINQKFVLQVDGLHYCIDKDTISHKD